MHKSFRKREFPEYDQLLADKRAAIQTLQGRVVSREILVDEILQRTALARWTRHISVASIYLAFLILAASLIWSSMLGPALSLLVVTLGIGLAVTARIAAERVKQNILLKHSDELEALDNSNAQAWAQIRSVAHNYDRQLQEFCDHCETYPPDWDRRRKAVLARDGYRCTKCGWCRDGRRRTRELHIHHVISLSDFATAPNSAYGPNHPSNLITLCSVCHRLVDEKHSGVTKLSRRRK